MEEDLRHYIDHMFDGMPPDVQAAVTMLASLTLLVRHSMASLGPGGTIHAAEALGFAVRYFVEDNHLNIDALHRTHCQINAKLALLGACTNPENIAAAEEEARLLLAALTKGGGPKGNPGDMI